MNFFKTFSQLHFAFVKTRQKLNSASITEYTCKSINRSELLEENSSNTSIGRCKPNKNADSALLTNFLLIKITIEMGMNFALTVIIIYTAFSTSKGRMVKQSD